MLNSGVGHEEVSSKENIMILHFIALAVIPGHQLVSKPLSANPVIMVWNIDEFIILGGLENIYSTVLSPEIILLNEIIVISIFVQA